MRRLRWLRRLRRLRAALGAAAPALLAYAGVRLLGLLVLALWAGAAGRSAHQLLSARWDSLWYTRVAEGWYGYSVRLPDGGVHSDLAFFPLLPALERGLAEVSPLAPRDAGLLVSALSSLAAAWALFLIGRALYGRRAGVLLAVLWAALPVGVVQSMAYSESLFTALAAWSLWAALTRRWVWAGALAACAGLTRPVGAAVVAAVWCAALLPLWREWRQRAREPARERPVRPGGRMALGLLLAPLGWLGYVAWVGARRGSVTGYLDVQGEWGNGFDGGWAFLRFIGRNLTGSVAGGLGLIAGVALVLWLYALCVRQRQPPALLVYAGAVVVLALCAKGYFGSKPRLLLPAFPLLLPAAAALARARTARAWWLLGLLAAASAVYGAWWLHGSGPP
nr:glycosyltransferase family 39 protein [Streptomyces boncukensis]